MGVLNGTARILVLLAVLSATSAGAADVPCATHEGAPIDIALGLIVCEGSARATPVTRAEPEPGARISAVSAAAADAGLLAGDVIYQINRIRVTSGQEALVRLRDRDPQSVTTINFWRDGASYLVRIWSDRP
jgi:S1-C subfamily serine protease